MTVQGRNGFALNLLHRGYADQGRVMVGPDWVPWPARHGTVELVDVGYARPEDLAGKQLKGKLALMRWGDDRYGAGGTGPDGNPDSFMWTDRVRALEDAGAIGYLAMSSPPPGWAGSPSFGTPTNFVSRPFGDGPSTITLPEVQIPRDQGEKLLRLTAKGTVRISLHADPNIRYTYRLYPQYEQQIPASQQQVYSARNLAEVDNEYHGTTPYQMDNRVTAYASGWPAIGTSILKAVGPTRRTDYYGPVSSRVTVQTSSQTSADGRNWTSIGAYDRPGEYQARWFLPATASGPYNLGAAGYAAQASSKSFINLLCDLCREGDLLWPWIAHPTGDGTVSLDMSAVPQLFGGDGAEIPLSSIPEADGLPAFRLPSGAADYHLVVDRPGEHTSWTFRSATPTRDTSVPGVECTGRVAADFGHCAVQPLIYLGYGFGSSVRLDNTVVAGRRHEFTVFARHDAAGAALPRIAGVRVWTSTDDGVTWQPATVWQGRHGYSVTAKYPPLSATTGAVSIKAEAWDVDGNRVDQVLTRAFPLAAR